MGVFHLFIKYGLDLYPDRMTSPWKTCLKSLFELHIGHAHAHYRHVIASIWKRSAFLFYCCHIIVLYTRQKPNFLAVYLPFAVTRSPFCQCDRHNSPYVYSVKGLNSLFLWVFSNMFFWTECGEWSDVFRCLDICTQFAWWPKQELEIKSIFHPCLWCMIQCGLVYILLVQSGSSHGLGLWKKRLCCWKLS